MNPLTTLDVGMLDEVWRWLCEAALWGTAVLALAIVAVWRCGPAARAAGLACGLAAAILIPSLRIAGMPAIGVPVQAVGSSTATPAPSTPPPRCSEKETMRCD